MTQVASGPPAPTLDRLRARWQRGLAVVCVALLPWLVAPGRVQPDTKLDLTVSPWRYLERATHAWSTHNGVGELQNQAYGYLFPMGPVHGGLLSLGVPAWGVQRLWWMLVLVVSFVGAERLLRRLGVQGTVPPLVGAAVFALSPRVLTMLAESSVELWPQALAPWLVLVAIPATAPGATGRDRRRAAVRTAALVACLGGVNATVDLFALAPAGLWLLLTGRGRLRALGWWVLAVLAGSAWWLVPLVVLGRYSYPFLDHIELASTTTGVATVINVLRGADHWLAYILTDAGHPVWQSGWVLAQSVIAVLATCGLAAAGLAGLTRSSVPGPVAARPGGPAPADVRRWALAALVAGVVVMAVGRSGTASGPLAETVRGLLDGPLAPLRNVHKADDLVRLPLALGTALVAHRLGSPRARMGVRARQLGVAGLVLALLGSTLPLWQGRVADAWGYEAIPLAVRQTATDVDRAAEQDAGSTIVLPAARMAHQSWGRTADEPLSALATSPVVARAAAPLGHPGATRLMDRVDRLASTGRAQPALVTALRRLGVSRVVVRYDTADDEPTLDPFTVEATLEATPGIDFVRTRGAGDTALTQWRVTPLRGSSAGTAGVSTALLDGVVVAAASPEGVVDLETAGVVDARSPVVLAGDAAPLGRGPDVVTDTLRWQLYNSGRPAHQASSATVRDGNTWPMTTGARALAPGDDPRWSTSRTWPGLASVEVSSSSADPFGTARGPASSGPGALVDGDPGTVWLSDPGDEQPSVTVTPSTAFDPTEQVEVSLPDGATRPARLEVSLGRVDGEGQRDEVDVPVSGPVLLTVPSGYETLTIRPVRAAGATGPVGIREIDLGRPAAYPVTRRAGTALSLPAAPGARAVLLTRDPRGVADLSLGEDPESLWRSVSGVTGTLVPQVWIRPRAGAALDRLFDSWDLAGSTRPVGADPAVSVAGRPGAAVDGDPTTRWQPDPAESRPRLRIDLGSAQPVTGLRLDGDPGGLVTVRTDTGSTVLPGDEGTVQVPAGATRTLELTFTRTPGWVAPEITVVGPARSASGTATLACGDAGAVRVDGSEVPLRAQLRLADVRAGTLVQATPCASMPVLDGESTAIEVAAGDAVVPERAVLAPEPELRPASGAARRVEHVRGDAEDRVIELGAGEETLLVTDQGANRGWAAVDPEGRGLERVTVDGWRQGFVVPAGQATSITVRYAPSGLHRTGLVVGGALALLCLLGGLVSLLRGRGGAVALAAPDAVPAGRGGSSVAGADGAVTSGDGAPLWPALLLAALVGLLVAGPLGLACAAVGALVPGSWRSRAVLTVLVAAGTGLAVLGVAERTSAGALLAQLLGAAALGVVCGALLDAGPVRGRRRGPEGARPGRGPGDGRARGPAAPPPTTTPPPGRR